MISRISLALLIVASLVPASAFADAPPPPPPAPYPYDQPVYVAPLSQQTQGTYVPQSVALSGPEEITDVADGRRAPAGYTEVMRKRKGLIIGGSVTLGVSYMYTALAAAIAEDASYDGSNELGALWIPVAGPWIQMTQTESATAKVLLAGVGSAQVAGAIMLYYGLAVPKRIFVRNDLVGSVRVSPMAGDGATGMVVSGRF